jgi:hypothetical protein
MRIQSICFRLAFTALCLCSTIRLNVSAEGTPPFPCQALGITLPTFTHEG